MPNPLALIGDSIKSAAPIVARLPFGFNSGITRQTIPVFMPDGLVQHSYAGIQNSVVAACVDAITRALPEAPLILQNFKKAKTGEGGEWERVESHEALDLFDANPDLSDSEIWGVTAAYKATRGRAYWVLFYNQAGTKPVEIWPWHPERVQVEGDKENFISKYRVQSEDGEWRDMAQSQIIHFRHLPNLQNHRDGCSPLAAGQPHLVGDNASAQYHAAILLNAGVMSLLISVKQGVAQGAEIKVTSDQFSSFLDALRRKYIGNKQAAGGIDGLNLPLEIQKMAFSPDEMAVDKLVAIFESKISALMGVNRKITGLGDDPTYANYAEAINDFWERRIVPERNKDAATLNRQLLPLFGLDKKEWRFAFDYSNVAALQENADQLFARWRELFKSGGCDLYTLQSRIGIANVPDGYKERFAGPQKPPEAPDAAP